MDEHQARGFSLLELLVALAILALALTTIYRIAGDAVAVTSSRERLVRLTALADAAWQELRLSGTTSADALTLALPEGVTLTVDEQPSAELGLAPATPLRAVRLELVDRDGGRFELHGIVRLNLDAGRER